MSILFSSPITSSWLHLPRKIQWDMFLGNRSNLVAHGSFDLSLSFMNSQGEKWGDTYIRDVGLHYDDYSNWDSKRRLYAIPKSTLYVNSPYELRKFKDAAGGVTGLIGEVLTAIFLQKVMSIPPHHIAHIKQTSTIKSPDFLLQISIQDIINIVSSTGCSNPALVSEMSTYALTDPLPLECKSRRYGSSRLRDALVQLIDYWKAVTTSAGYGAVALVSLYPQTSLELLLFLPRHGKQSYLTNIINTSIYLDDTSGETINLTEKNFFSRLRGCFLE